MNTEVIAGKRGEVYGLVITGKRVSEGVVYFTDPAQTIQVGAIKYPAKHVIPAHEHPVALRKVRGTPEVLVIRKGWLRVDFYDSTRVKVASGRVGPGDIVVLLAGGHGFEVIEDVELIEVRQGPYFGAADKVRFDSTVTDTVKEK